MAENHPSWARLDDGGTGLRPTRLDPRAAGAHYSVVGTRVKRVRCRRTDEQGGNTLNLFRENKLKHATKVALGRWQRDGHGCYNRADASMGTDTPRTPRRTRRATRHTGTQHRGTDDGHVDRNIQRTGRRGGVDGRSLGCRLSPAVQGRLLERCEGTKIDARENEQSLRFGSTRNRVHVSTSTIYLGRSAPRGNAAVSVKRL